MDNNPIKNYVEDASKVIYKKVGEEFVKNSSLDEKLEDLKLRSHIGEKLEYGFFSTGEIKPVSNTTCELKLINGNMENNNGNIKLKAYKKYSIIFENYKITSSGTTTTNQLVFYLLNSNGDILLRNDTVVKDDYNTWSRSNTKILSLEPKEDMELILKCNLNYNNYITSAEANILVQEIGREVLINEVEEVAKNNNIEDTPVGHIMSIMGVNPPPHYLICDGSEYNIADYPKLAEYFKTELGSINYFGGDGTSTFAVPNITDDRYLKGSKINIGNLEDEGLPNLTGKITNNLYVTNGGSSSGVFTGTTTSSTKNYGSSGFGNSGTINFNANNSNTVYGNSQHVTPKNISVLFCIKYEPTYFMQYSPMYGGFDETLIFEGEANTVGEYSLSDSIKDYKMLIVYCSQNWNTNNNLLTSTMTINVSSIENNKSQQFEFNLSLGSTSDDRRVIFNFDLENNKLKITTVNKSISANCKSMQISKIIGIKANSNTIIKNEEIEIDSITYTDDELKSIISNIKGGDNNE